MSHALKDGDVISLITTSATCSLPTATSTSTAANSSTGSSAANNGQQQQQQPLGRVHTQVTLTFVMRDTFNCPVIVTMRLWLLQHTSSLCYENCVHH
jgi:hypothetical protein